MRLYFQSLAVSVSNQILLGGSLAAYRVERGYCRMSVVYSSFFPFISVLHMTPNALFLRIHHLAFTLLANI